MGRCQDSSEYPKSPSAFVRDLDVDDLLGGEPLSQTEIDTVSTCLDSTVMLPPARCFKGRLLADQDIFSADGELLLKSGQVLNADSAELLAKKRMEENPLNLPPNQRELEIKELVSDFQRLIKKVAGLECFVEHEGGLSYWQKMLKELLPSYDEGLAYLAYLRDHCEESYEQSLFCSWLGVQLAQSMALHQDKIKYALLSGLFHLVGKLYLPESLRHLAENRCESRQWNEFQHHVVYGKLLIQEAGDVGSRVVTEIIVQQGEYANSLGYPFSLTKESLHQESMLLSLSRDLYQLLFIDGAAMSDGLLFLQLHEARFGQAASWAMQKKIKSFIHTQDVETYAEYLYSEQMADYLIETSIVLAQLHAAASLIVAPIRVSLAKGDKRYLVTHLVNLLRQIEEYKNNSGIADIAFVAGIDSMQYEDAQQLSGEIYQIVQRQRGLLALFSEVDALVGRALDFIKTQGESKVIAEVQDLSALIHDALEPFRNHAH